MFYIYRRLDYWEQLCVYDGGFGFFLRVYIVFQVFLGWRGLGIWFGYFLFCVEVIGFYRVCICVFILFVLMEELGLDRDRVRFGFLLVRGMLVDGLGVVKSFFIEFVYGRQYRYF